MSEEREPIPLGEVCPRCNLDSKFLRFHPVCASSTQAWEVFTCTRCQARGMVGSQLWSRIVRVFRWNPQSSIAQMFFKNRGG